MREKYFCPVLVVRKTFAVIDVQSSDGDGTFDRASAIAAIIIPSVSIPTLNTCILVYLFPQMKPTSMVVTLPPLRRMMCTGTEIA